jgi:hypothetical protein
MSTLELLAASKLVELEGEQFCDLRDLEHPVTAYSSYNLNGCKRLIHQPDTCHILKLGQSGIDNRPRACILASLSHC